MNKDRLQFLDALRGLAVLLVIFWHFSQDHSPMVKAIGGTMFQFGQAGVSLFFLISGYIIPRSINGAATLRVFWAHRVVRLFPIYLISIVAALAFSAIGLFHLPKDLSAAGILVNFTMLQGFVGVSHVIDVFWSLKFEMAFYILMTGVAAMGWTRHPLRIFQVYTGATLLIAVGCLAIGRYFPYGLYHIGLMLLGWVLGEWHSGRVRLASMRAALALGALATVVEAFSAFHGRPDPGGYGTQAFVPMLNAWVGAIALFVAVLFNAERLETPAWLSWLGVISYSIYLLHRLVLSSLEWLADDLGLLAIPVWLVVTVTVSTITYRLIEAPMVQIGRRVFPQRKGGAIAGA